VTRCSHHRYRDAGEVVGFSDLSSVGEGKHVHYFELCLGIFRESLALLCLVVSI